MLYIAQHQCTPGKQATGRLQRKALGVTATHLVHHAAGLVIVDTNGLQRQSPHLHGGFKSLTHHVVCVAAHQLQRMLAVKGS